MPDTEKYETLRVARDGPVGWLVFDRPAQGNALDAAMLDGLEAAWRALEDDPEVRVIVNTGNGAAFQTGLDVALLARDPEALREQSRRTRRAELRMTASGFNSRTRSITAPSTCGRSPRCVAQRARAGNGTACASRCCIRRGRAMTIPR